MKGEEWKMIKKIAGRCMEQGEDCQGEEAEATGMGVDGDEIKEEGTRRSW